MSTPVVSPEPPIVIAKSWDGPSADDYVIREPFAKLEAKYFYAPSTLSLEFDLYAARRAVDPGWANRIEGADLAATHLMNSRVSAKNVDAVMANRRAIDAALAAVPDGLDLAFADLGVPALRVALLDLFRSFRVDDGSVAKATKVLCLKRPRLIPVIDRYALDALFDAHDRPTFSPDPDEFAGTVLDAVGRFRRMMLWRTPDGRTNLDGLIELADRLSAEASARLTAEGVGPPHPRFTPVRVYGNLLWFDGDGYQNFDGWAWDQTNRRVWKPGPNV